MSSGIRRISLLAPGIALLLTGCASMPGSNPKDPWENYNRSIYKFNEALDKAVLKPVAQGYIAVLPEPARVLLNNFFSNLDDVTVTLNDVLQLKLKQAVSDGSRVLFNSTFGIFGLLNVTDQLEKHNEDFGQTLGYWGIGSGPYLMLPFFGPSSIRDGVGLYGDAVTGVISNINDRPARYGLFAGDEINTRARLLDREKTLEEASDRYAFIRDFYIARRQNLVYDGNPPREKYIDEED
ncbi:MAG: VacJ family lipoprotein [Gallionellaceae bacterium]|nr:MAG: VacJ family lipoprotein [Gallionellaceae bacterium]